METELTRFLVAVAGLVPAGLWPLVAWACFAVPLMVAGWVRDREFVRFQRELEGAS